MDDAYNAVCETLEDQSHDLTPGELESLLRAVIAHCMALLEELPDDPQSAG